MKSKFYQEVLKKKNDSDIICFILQYEKSATEMAAIEMILSIFDMFRLSLSLQMLKITKAFYGLLRQEALCSTYRYINPVSNKKIGCVLMALAHFCRDWIGQSWLRIGNEDGRYER